MKGILVFCMLLVSGCASVVSKVNYPVTINSSPTGANVEIKDENGVTRFQGVTPAVVPLPAGESYFDSHDYTLTFSKDGYQPQISKIDSSVDPWYWGNIIIGGVPGFLIIDPITGAMYELDQTSVAVNLPPVPVAVPVEAQSEVSGVEQKLSELKAMQDKGLITKQDFEKTKLAMLGKM